VLKAAATNASSNTLRSAGRWTICGWDRFKLELSSRYGNHRLKTTFCVSAQKSLAILAQAETRNKLSLSGSLLPFPGRGNRMHAINNREHSVLMAMAAADNIIEGMSPKGNVR
jgi:hypothetical protein